MENKTSKEIAISYHLNPSAEQRYGNELYDVHLRDVVKNIKKYLHLILNDEHKKDVIDAGWFHDTIEDTEMTPRKLAQLTNENVAKIVTNVSNVRTLNKTKEILLTLANICEDELSTFVKICDRMANAANSRKHSDEKANRMYKNYQLSYPTFRFALKKEGRFNEMWKELDSILNYKEHTLTTTSILNIEKVLVKKINTDEKNKTQIILEFLNTYPEYLKYIKDYHRLPNLEIEQIAIFLTSFKL